MAKYRQVPGDMVAYTTDVAKRVDRLERVPRAIATGVDSGSLTITNGILQLLPNATQSPTLLASSSSVIGAASQVAMYRNVIGTIAQVGVVGGTVPSDLAFLFIDEAIGFGLGGTFNVYDRAGQQSGVLLSDASNINALGFGEPRFHVHFWDPANQRTTTSTTFVNIRSCYWYATHPHLRVRVLAQSPTGSTGQVRVNEQASGQQAIATLASGSFAYVDLIVDRRTTSNYLAGNIVNGNPLNFDLEFKLVSGAGPITVTYIEAVAIDLSFQW